jgi:hypothetical protein
MTTMDPSNETDNTTPTVTYADHDAAALTVHIPDFKQPALASALLSSDYTPCKTMFADADWITHLALLFSKSIWVATGCEVGIVVRLGGVGGCAMRRYFFRKVFGRQMAAKSISWSVVGVLGAAKFGVTFFEKYLGGDWLRSRHRGSVFGLSFCSEVWR